MSSLTHAARIREIGLALGTLRIGKIAKYLALLLLLLNARSFPLAWHFRVFSPIFLPRLRMRWLKLTAPFKSRRRVLEDEEHFWTSRTPIGEDPFQMTSVSKTWASIDDSDFNLHLSNSSYAKTLDNARFKAALMLSPQFFRVGGNAMLAATHYHFIREIPMLRSYEVRVHVGAWDHKWFYIVAKFVTVGKKGEHKGQEIPAATPKPTEGVRVNLHTPATPSEIATPNLEAETPPTNEQKSGNDIIQALKAASESATLATKGPDGATLHTVAISRVCYKIGRITVPPALVLATNGISVNSPNGEAPYSRSNPPPHWQKVRSLMARLEGGSPKKMREFMIGGWRAVPEEQRWWQDALGGEIEVNRKANLEALDAMTKGMSVFGSK